MEWRDVTRRMLKGVDTQKEFHTSLHYAMSNREIPLYIEYFPRLGVWRLQRRVTVKRVRSGQLAGQVKTLAERKTQAEIRRYAEAIFTMEE